MPKEKRIHHTEDRLITKRIQALAGNPVGYQVEFLDHNGDPNGPRVHKVPAEGWYALDLWVSKGRGFGANRTYEGAGSVCALFNDGVLVGFEGELGTPTFERTGSGEFTPI